MIEKGCLFVSQQIKRHYSSRIRLSSLSFVQSGPPGPRIVSYYEHTCS